MLYISIIFMYISNDYHKRGLSSLKASLQATHDISVYFSYKPCSSDYHYNKWCRTRIFFGLEFSMATSEELIGINGDLTDAVRAQRQSSKKVTSRTQDQIQEHSQAVPELSTSVRTQFSSSASTLRLLPLSLPKFTGGEFLDRFLDQIS